MTAIIYHPGTGTIVPLEDCVVVDTETLPPDVEEWETYLATTDVPYTELGKLLAHEGHDDIVATHGGRTLWVATSVTKSSSTST